MGSAQSRHLNRLERQAGRRWVRTFRDDPASAGLDVARQTAGFSGVLSAQQITDLEQAGFLTLPCIITTAEVTYVRDTLMALHENKAGFQEGAQFDALGTDDGREPPRFPQILHPRVYAPGLRNTAIYRATLAMARQILGPRARLSVDISFLKPAFIGPATPWHQDEAFHDPRFDYRQISFWLALQPTDRANGCMEFLPGSHMWPVLQHGRPNGDERIHALECVDEFDRSQAVACQLPAGGCTIHTQRTLHATGPNTSDRPRLAYALLYDLPPIPAQILRSFPWQANERTARLARERDWRRRGGILIHAWRQRSRLKLDPGRVLADLRRAALALRVLRS
jgi:hypothetical protein